MMAYKGSVRAWEENFDEFIYQFKPKIKSSLRKLETFLIKLY